MPDTDSTWPASPGATGAGARRARPRRRARREERVRSRNPRPGGIALAPAGAPRHEGARGAEGGERVAAVMARRLSADVMVLHHRRMPRSRANIDHLAVAPSGVWVIDDERSVGKVEVQAPPMARPRLIVGGHDRTPVVDGLDKQVATVEALLRHVARNVPVHGALCFVEADLPIFRTLRFRRCVLLPPRRLVKLIDRPGPVEPDEVRRIAGALGERLPPA